MPIVITVFDMIHEDFPQLYPDDRTSEAKRRSVASARRIIAISAYTKARLIEHFGINADRIDVVHLGLSDLWRQPVTPPTDLDLPPFILFVGSRYGYKNFDALLDAFGRSGLAASGVSLLAFGGGEFSSAELRRVHELGLDGRVSQMGGSDSLLAAIYRRAILLAYPSLDEGFGLPPLEAMASGCPVACSRAGAIPEVVGDAAVMFDPQDQEEIADALVRLTHDSELRDEVIKLGRKRAALFTLRQQAEQTLMVYRHALEG